MDVFGVIVYVITMMSEQKFSLEIMMTFELPLHKL